MDARADIFETARPQLLGLAYRLLGSMSDAQDAVQDTFVKWAEYRGPVIETPAAWLSRVCTNRCLDQLKAAHRARVTYVGPWLPDHIVTEHAAGPEEQSEIASSLTTAFLLLLERLTPKERAAYLLHDIFDTPFEEVAFILDLQPANCRKLAARARDYVSKQKVRHVPDDTRQSELLSAFQSALRTGDTAMFGKLLRADADLRADSGGKVIAIRHAIGGPEHICRFISTVLSPAWHDKQITPISINGTLGVLVGEEGRLHASLSFACDSGGLARNIFIIRHPDKLASRGLPESMRAVAEERSREINKAYDLIKEARGIV